jgi:hypothetical protein
MKFEISDGFEPEVIPKAFWKPGRDGTIEEDPWSHADDEVSQCLRGV